MPFDPDQYVNQAQDMSSPTSFDPDAYIKAAPPTQVESALVGGAQGATWGFLPKVAGAIGAGGGVVHGISNALTGQGSLSDIPSEAGRGYDYMSQGLHDYINKAQAANPKTFAAANLAGTVVSPLNEFIPGGGLAKNIAGGSLAGGAMAAGQSTHNPFQSQDELGSFTKDVGTGMAFGAAGGAAGSAIGAGVSALGKAPKKAASVLLGAPEEAVDRYIANPEAVMNSPSVTEGVQNVKNLVGNLKSSVQEGSQGARGVLEKAGQSYKGSDIAKIFEDKIQGIVDRSEGALSPSQEATIKALKQHADTFGGQNSDKVFSGNRVKDLVQEIQGQVNYNQLPGQFTPPDQATLKNVAATLNQRLKTDVPEYSDAMQDVASKAGLLKEAQGMFRSDQGLANTLNRVRRERAPFQEDVLNRLDNNFGTSTVEDMRNALAREAFEKGANTPGGSRNVQLYSHLLGGENRPLGRAAGALIGATVDKFGPGLAKGGIDAYRAVAPYAGAAAELAAPVTNAFDKVGLTPEMTDLNPAVTQYLLDKYKGLSRNK